ncbi:MAG: calcium-binding protein [Betaproteobacteria bacterium]
MTRSFLGLTRTQLASLALVASDASYEKKAGWDKEPVLRELPDTSEQGKDPFPQALQAALTNGATSLDDMSLVDARAAFTRWRPVRKVIGERTGFGAAIYVSLDRTNDSGVVDGPGRPYYNLIVAFEGSNGADPVDWYQNADLARRVWEQDRVRTFEALADSDLLAKVEGLAGDATTRSTAGRRVLFTGQSLGGGLAQYAAYDYVRLSVAPSDSAVEPRPRPAGSRPFDPRDVALVTFNGFGAAGGIASLMSTRNIPYDPVLLHRHGVVAEHFGVANDIVHRISGSHIPGVGSAAALLEFRRFENGVPVDGPRNYLDIVDAHRIEAGFYRGFANHRTTFDTGPWSTAARPFDYLETGEMQQVAAYLSRVFRKDGEVKNDLEAVTRLFVGAVGVLLIGSPNEVRAVVDALAYNQWRADRWSMAVRWLFNLGAFAKILAGPTGAVRGEPLIWASMLAASLCDLFRLGSRAPDRALANQLLQNLDVTFPDGRTRQVRIPDNFRPDPETAEEERAHRAAIISALAEPGSVLSDLLGRPSPVLSGTGKPVLNGYKDAVSNGRFQWTEQEVAQLAATITEEGGWRKALLARIGELARAKRLKAEETVSITVALSDAMAASAQRIAPDTAYAKKVLQEHHEFLRRESRRVSSLRDTYLGDDSAPAGGGAEAGSVAFVEYRALAQAFLDDAGASLELLAPDVTGDAALDALRAQVKDGLAEVARAMQQVAITRPGESNPFADVAFDPAPGRLPAAPVGHGVAAALQVRLPTAAGAEGLRVALDLGGSGTETLFVTQGGRIVPHASGRWVLEVLPGRDRAVFVIEQRGHAMNPGVLALTAQLLASDDTPLHTPQVLGSLPMTGFEYRPARPVDDAGESQFRTGTDRGDVMVGWGGDDVLVGGLDPDDTPPKPKSREWSAPFDYLSGDDPRELYLPPDSNWGNDRLYGDEEVADIPAYIEATAAGAGAGAGSGSIGDWLRGSRGQDLLVGGGSDDVLFGGWHEDVLVGGAGRDFLCGDDSLSIAGDEAGQSPYRITTTSNPFEVIIHRLVLFGNESPEGGGAADALYAGGGDDIALGEFGDDLLYGDDGADILAGGAGADIVNGGAGADRIAGDWGVALTERVVQGWPGGNDVIDAGDGDDEVRGEFGNDTLYGGDGDDHLYGEAHDKVLDTLWAGDDFLDGGAGNDHLRGDGGGDELHGGSGDDEIFGDGDDVPEALHGADRIWGGPGDDYARGYGGNDRLQGGPGRDQLRGEAGDDTVEGDDGDDRLWGGTGSDTLGGGEGDDDLDGGEGRDRLAGGTGADRLRGGADDDVLKGDAGADDLSGDAGSDTLRGGSGDDSLSGGEGDDALDGGAGRDLLAGGPGNDTYLFRPGDSPERDSADTIDDASGLNGVRFDAVVMPQDLVIHEDRDRDLLVLEYSPGDVLLIRNGYRGAVTWFQFADGAVLSAAQVIGAARDEPMVVATSGPGAVVYGGAADDDLTATGGGSLVSGGRGDDTITTSGVGDTLLYERGDGADTVLRPEEDGPPVLSSPGWSCRVRLGADILPDEITLGAGGLTLHIGGDPGDSIRFDGFDAADPFTRPVLSYLEFSDGTRLGLRDLLARGFDVQGREAGETLRGTPFRDRLRGFGGDDTLLGGAGDDDLVGDEGNDLLDGGQGDDLYRLAIGAGTDRIVDAGGRNRVVFAAGIDPSQVRAEALAGLDGSRYLKVRYGPSDEVLVRVDTGEGAVPFVFEFADGTELSALALASRDRAEAVFHVTFEGPSEVIGSRLDDTLWGGPEADRFDGGGGDDELAGGGGSDWLAGGDGRDWLTGGEGDDRLMGGPGEDTYQFFGPWGRDRIVDTGPGRDVLVFEAMPLHALEAGRSDADLQLRRRGGTDVVTLEGFFAPEGGAAQRGWTLRTRDGEQDLAAALPSLLPEPVAGTVEGLIEAFGRRVRDFFGRALEAAGYVRGDDGTFRRQTVRDLSTATDTWRERFDLREPGQDVSGDGVRVSDGFDGRSDSRVVASTRETRQLPASDVLQVVVGRSGDQQSLVQQGVPIPRGQLVGSDGVSRSVEGYAYAGGSNAGVYRHPVTGAGIYYPRVVSLAPDAGNAGGSTWTYAHTLRTLEIDYWSNFLHLTAGVGDDDIVAGARWRFDRPEHGFRFGFLTVAAGPGDDRIRPEASSQPGSSFLPVGRLPWDGVTPPAAAPGGLLFGDAGNDIVEGGAHDDVLVGGTGDDFLAGGEGNDEYVFLHGDGRDTVFEAGATLPGIERDNVLVLPAGVRSGDLRPAIREVLHTGAYDFRAGEGPNAVLPDARSHEAASLHAAVDLSWGTADGVRVIVPHAEHLAARGLDALRFSDGSRMSFDSLLARLGPVDLNPQDRGNVLVAGAAGEVLAGMGGDDSLIGGAGNDELFGGSGADALSGGAGDDRLYGGQFHRILRGEVTPSRVGSTLEDAGNRYAGGAGDDALWGTAGADVFLVERGDGQDVIRDLLHEESEIGVLADYTRLLTDGTALANYAATVDTLRFGTGIRPDAVQVARTRVIDRVAALEGTFEDRNDLVFAYDGPWHSVRVKNWFDPTLRAGYLAGFDGAQAPHQLRRAEFADGTVWDLADILARVDAPAPAFRGNSAPRSREPGLLTLRPGAEFDIDLARLAFQDDDPGDRLILTARMEDGTALPDWGWPEGAGGHLAGRAPDSPLEPFAVRLQVSDRGLATAESRVRIEVRETNRAPVAQVPMVHADVTEGERWSLSLREGLFQDEDPGDRLSFTLAPGGPGMLLPGWVSLEPGGHTVSGIPGPLDVADVAFRIVATDLAGASASLPVEAIVAPAAGRTLEGGAGPDRLRGTSSSDRLAGRGGDDLLEGFGGDDVYHWNPGDGLDTVADTGGRDVLVLGAGVAPEDVVVRIAGEGADRVARVRVRGPGGAERRLEGVDIRLGLAGADTGVESLAFHGGETLGLTTRIARDRTVALTGERSSFSGDDDDEIIRVSGAGVTVAAGPGNDRVTGGTGSLLADGGPGEDHLAGSRREDYLSGGSGDDIIVGGAGQDSLRGGPGHNLVLGGAGNDWLFGAGQQDLLAGGTGDDRIELVQGDYVIGWNPGDGQDTLRFLGPAGAVVSLGGGLSPADVALSREGEALCLVTTAGEGLRFEHWYSRFERRNVRALQFITAESGTPVPRVLMADFAAVAESFDDARQRQPGLSRWALADALSHFHLGEGNAFGGDLAAACAVDPAALASAPAHRITDTLAAPGFAVTPQALREPGWLLGEGVGG